MTAEEILERLLDNLDEILDGPNFGERPSPLVDMIDQEIETARADFQRLKLGVYRRAA